MKVQPACELKETGTWELRPHCKIKESVTGSTADRYPPVLCPFVDPREVSGLGPPDLP